MPLPFTRELKVQSPLQAGDDVKIAQTLLNRNPAVAPTLVVDGYFGDNSARGVQQFQNSVNFKVTGILDDATARKLLELHSADGFKDPGFTAASKGYLYKLYVPVHVNRSIETTAILFDKDNNELLRFIARTHGYRDDGTTGAWPDFGTGDVGLNEFTDNGMTVTGLMELDLNSPEPSAAAYGPWPVNRFVRGLDGNALLLVPNIRDGILLHTGNWSTASRPWDSSMPMPNSAGCVHAHPEDGEAIYKILVGLGVKVNDNTFSGKNYPYKPQGLAVVELVE